MEPGDDYNKSFNAGDRLILELTNGDIFEGLYSGGGKHFIELTDVVQHNNNNTLNGIYAFHRGEIAKIHRLKGPASKQTKPDCPLNTNGCKTIKVCENDYFRLKELSSSYIYIENPDKRYFQAIEVLENSETIGVVSLGAEMHRSQGSLQLLVLSTWNQIYIFDLAHLEKKQLYPELKHIFESEYICKVIHKSAGLVDKLYREYNIYVQNTFDTQIVDLMLQKRESGNCPSFERSISECLVHYLNFPSSILEKALEVPNKSWCERPLSEKMKVLASQHVTYLILLKEQFQKLLLKDVYDTINKVQDHVYDMDDFNYLNFIASRNVKKDIQDLIPNLQRMTVGENSVKKEN
ncbi:piRNA biogenesis protein EXD1-like [Anthonomus grandis grandis]|uniref:piRNA biogenesis protein EXD1-like n=1 Tax=Anthonomus grandis grandis TaxID=2921223 RepID=UPI002165CAA3|nr:piRNA biogenesis protein EXD1-like [Anthonomus grandis grandis]